MTTLESSDKNDKRIAVESIDDVTESMTGMVKLDRRDEERKWLEKREARRCWHTR